MSSGNTASAQLSTPSPASPWLNRGESPRDHDVQFYADDDFLLESLTVFLGKALQAGNSAVVVATRAHRESLARRLEATGVQLAAAIEHGRYVALDAAGTLAAFMVDGLPDKARFTEVIGGVITRATAASQAENAQLAVFGEMVALLWEQGNGEAAVQLEDLWNELSHTHAFSLRCAYHLASFNRAEHGGLFARICGQHHAVIPAETYTSLGDDNDRFRTVALLQQSEQALKTEALERRMAEARTGEVQSQNEQLAEQVQKRKHAEEELRRFARRLLAARDEEQRQVARELHENTAQLLSALSLYLGILQEEGESLNPRVAGVVANSRSVAQKLLKQVSKLSYLLHPPTLDELGLSVALTEYVGQLMECSSATVNLNVAQNLGRLPRRMEITIFRIVEEALDGLRLQAGDPSATVRLGRSGEQILLEIHDHGTGICSEKEAASLDITGMRERARHLGGTVNIRFDGQSTLVSVALPAEESLSAMPTAPAQTIAQA